MRPELQKFFDMTHASGMFLAFIRIQDADQRILQEQSYAICLAILDHIICAAKVEYERVQKLQATLLGNDQEGGE